MDLMLCINSTYEIRMWDRVRHLHRVIWGDGISQITLQSRISFGMHPSLAQAELILSYVVSIYIWNVACLSLVIDLIMHHDTCSRQSISDHEQQQQQQPAASTQNEPDLIIMRREMADRMYLENAPLHYMDDVDWSKYTSIA